MAAFAPFPRHLDSAYLANVCPPARAALADLRTIVRRYFAECDQIFADWDAWEIRQCAIAALGDQEPLWRDDSQVVDLVARKRYAIDSPPRWEIAVQEMP